MDWAGRDSYGKNKKYAHTLLLKAIRPSLTYIGNKIEMLMHTKYFFDWFAACRVVVAATSFKWDHTSPDETNTDINELTFIAEIKEYSLLKSKSVPRGEAF